jgi:predicted RecB family endonuclease
VIGKGRLNCGINWSCCVAEKIGRRYVVIIGRDAAQGAQKIATELEAVPGVEVSATSQSYVDIVADVEIVTEIKLRSVVSDLGAELHSSPQAQLMDPIPPRKIP